MRIANPKVFGLFGRLLAVAVLASMIALPAGQAAAQDTLAWHIRRSHLHGTHHRTNPGDVYGRKRHLWICL